MEWDRQKSLSFWTIFPFQPPQTAGNENVNIDKNIWSYYHFTHLHNKWQSYDYGSWDMECNRHNFLWFWRVLCLLPLLWTQKMKILENILKTPEDIIILQICTINDSHMTYSSWDMECDRQNCFVILGYFLPP